ncbi:hypothetical protein D3C78_1828300 [compost metagenome]
MNSKFMPYKLDKNMRGRKMALKIVNVFMISFIRSDFILICISTRLLSDSR